MRTHETQRELFIYDRLIVQSPSPRSVKYQHYDIPIPQSYHVTKPPEITSEQNEFESWKSLFEARRDWTHNVFRDCSNMADEAQKRRFEIEVIIRAASTAVLNVQKHVTTVDHKNALIQNWVEDICKAQESTGTDWNALLERLRAIIVTDEVIKFITGQQPSEKQSGTLENLINMEKFQKSKKLLGEILRKLSRSSVELGKKVDEIYRLSDELVDIVSETMPEKSQVIATLDPIQLLQDTEALANKFSSDCKNVLESQNLKNVPQITKCALTHTKKLLPSLSRRVVEMNHLLQNVTETRNSLASLSMGVMQRISSLTSMVSEVTLQLTNLEPNEGADDALQMLLDIKLLPLTYASFLAEGIRRKQWKERITTDLSTLSNELKVLQEEEARRRRKWQKSIGVTLWGKRMEQNIPYIEFSLRDSEDDWPETSHKNLEDVVAKLRAREPNSALAVEVSKIISDLSHPTKQQSKFAKAAFKAGSFYENGLGRSSLLVRGDDELVRILREEGQKTASKLKTAESRVRRLENLLHQQTQVNRTTTGNIFQMPNRLLPDTSSTPNPAQPLLAQDNQSRHSSASSHRFSINQAPDEKFYQQKIRSLEAEIAAERERSVCLEKDILERKKLEDDLRLQIEETNSVKEDLLKNLEAQQREFIEERKSLAIEIKRVQAQKEDLENDLDQYVISRETEKDVISDHESNLDSRFEQARDGSTEESHDNPLLISTGSEQMNSGSLKTLIPTLRQRNDELISRTIKAERAIQEQLHVLQNIYQLIPNSMEKKGDFASIAEALASGLGGLVSELDFAKSDVLSLKANCDRYECNLNELKSENTNIKQKLIFEESNSVKSCDMLAKFNAKLVSLERELTDERSQTCTLKDKTASIESHSESLRNCLLEEERKAICMNDCITMQQFRVESLENEVQIYQEKYQSIQNLYDKLRIHFDGRTSNVNDLTQRFFVQNDRLYKLLERLSYCIIRDGKSVTIQRLPKPERSNANDSSDPNSTIKRSLLIARGNKSIMASGELEMINWTHDDDPEIEKKNYDEYLNTVGFLDIDSVCEIIVKRIKDLEYTAKKFSRDARSYRDKSHASQKEAHEKIAFKNFKEGDLVLFLPTRNQATGAWAAFNVGAPHYFLKEQESHKLRSRDWLLARISKIEDRVVDLSKSLPVSHLQISGRGSLGEASTGADSFEDDNPFDLSDGLRWYLIEATEEKPGAPATPGLGKCTVASANIDATGSIRRSKKTSSSGMEGINKTLSKNLHIRRDSINSKKSLSSVNSLIKTGSNPADTACLKAAPTTRTVEEGPEAHIIKPCNSHDGNASGCADRALSSEVRSQPGDHDPLVNSSNPT